jgi:uncharacterized SAM-binding protein YcdF (DUF218 family)
LLADIASMFSSPIVHGPILSILLLLIGYLTAKPKLGKTLSVVPLIWLLFCSMTYPSVLLIKPLEDIYPVIKLESQEWQTTQAIVVLACNYFEDDELPFISRWPNCSLQRNLHAALMYKKHNLPIYLAGEILGDKAKYPQAHHNRYFLETLGVDIKDIVTVTKGNDTESEVKALANLLDGKSISLVTSASHLPRAVKYFEDYNVTVLPIPVEHFSRRTIEPKINFPNALSLYRSERAIHEYLGLIYQQYIR